MFHRKIDELFNGIPKVYHIADDILIAEFDELRRDHDATLYKVLRIYREVNLKLKRINASLGAPVSPFGEIILWYGVSLDPRKVQVLTDMPPPKSKKELQSFLGILNYLSKFSPMTAEVCKYCRNLHQ